MLSPQKAAERLGVSRQTVVNAIKAGKLLARRNNNNHWIIDPSDLEAWVEGRGAKAAPITSATQNSTASDSAMLHQKDLQVARLEEQLRASEQKVDDLTSQLAKRDADHQEAMAKRDTDYREAMAMLKEAQRPLWVRLKDAFSK